MMAAERLYALQQLDTRAERLREQAVALRRAVDGDSTAPDPRPRVEILRSERAVLYARVREAESEDEGQRARAKSHERRLMGGSIHNPKELSKLSEELDHMRSRMAVQETNLLEMLEAQETLDARLREAEQQAVADAATLRHIEGELARIGAERAAAVQQLSADQRNLYDRVRRLREPAVVEVRNGACGGCRLPVAPTRLKLARGEEPTVCEACNRILYLA